MKINKVEDLKIINASDKVIEDLSENNLITTWKDFNLHYTHGDTLKARRGSTCDGVIFGSIFSDTCNCGKVTKYNVECSQCHSMRLDDETSYMRFGRIELPVYYLSSTNIKAFKNFFYKLFSKTILDVVSNENSKGIPLPDLWELYQFNYDASSSTLIISDYITDINKCSYEGLYDIIMRYFPSNLGEYLNYVNKYLLVVPLPVRPIQITYYGDVRKLKFSPITAAYQSILRATEYYNTTYSDKISNLVELNLVNATLRAMVRSCTDELSSLLASSKENFARNIQGTRLPNSGRCVITPDPKLKLDEVSIPRSLMYEAAGEGFIKYLTQVTDFDEKQARRIYIDKSNTVEIQNLFTKYVEGDPSIGLNPLCVLINRQPTLYEDNYLCSKVILNNEEVMKIPLSICANFNADFDGDQMSFVVVSNDQYDYVNDRLNASKILYKKKNLDPSFLPRQEILAGLIIASRISLVKTPEVFDSLERAEEACKNSNTLSFHSQVIINGRITTIGRAKLSELFDTDLDAILGGPNILINKNNVLDLYNKLHSLPDWIDRQSEIEKFALLCVTLNGSTTLTLDKLMKDVDPKFYAEVEKISNNKVITDKQKSLRYQEIYSKYANEHLGKYSEEIKIELSNQARASIDNLVKTSFPTMIVGLAGNFRPSKGTLIEGIDARDYKELSISSRAVSDIKVAQTPASGNTTRLLVFALKNFIYKEGSDDNNPGILIEAWRAQGRTKVDGTIVPRTGSTELVRVKSILTSTLMNPYEVTPDMISNLFSYRDDQAIGMSWALIWNESTTQSALALKHKGQLFTIDEDSTIIATSDCTVEDHDAYLEIIDKKGAVSIYPKPHDYIQNYSPNNKYKKGSIIGAAWKIVLPSYKLGQIIELISTRLIKTKKSYDKNNITISECYAYHSGIINYEFDNNTCYVTIGNDSYSYNPYSVYFYPKGTYIEKGTRICSGLVDIKAVFDRTNDYIESFYIFDKQLLELTKTTNPELNEAIYKAITVTDEFNHIILNGVRRTNKNNRSPYSRMAYEDSKAYFKNVLAGNVTDFTSDSFSVSLLNHILQGKIGLNQ